MIVDENGMCTLSEEDRSYHSHTAKRTNADCVRAMTDEELADFITDDLCELLCGAPLVCEGQCKQKMLGWLKQEAT